MSKEVCTIRITMENPGWGGEDIVKETWGYFVPWFTRRHGVEGGEIRLEIPQHPDDTCQVSVTWKYETLEDGSDNSE